ncbi:FtsX-like permease family protein [Actinoplanes sp. NPDC051343]|uniref:FtsX-like permease family protein n=1 Tax=Actinoplanes sp. NPDC051343 TaxID=3363906 RepID=UPI0037B00EFE
MIALVLTMVWNRRGQAAVLALLALFGVTAAVAAPAFLRAADRAVAAGQVANAQPAELSLEILSAQIDHRHDAPGAPTSDVNLPTTGGALTDLPGFQYVYAVEFSTVGIDPDDQNRTRFVYRQRVCEHLTIVAGRCLAGEGDVILGAQMAKKFHLKPGDSVTLTYATHASGPPPAYVPAGDPKQFLVAGIYRVAHPDDVFWGPHEYFTAGDEPAFAGSASLAAMDKGSIESTLDGYAGPGALAVDKLPAIRTGLAQLQASAAQLGPGLQLSSGLTTLMARIDQGRTAAHRIVPVLAVCLVLLTCLTIFLAVGYGTEGRRPELAVVALRGARWGQRWWLATGENLVAILAGSIAGCLTGQLVVNLFAAWRFPGVGADAGLASLRWAPVAAGAALITALAAERRQLATPVTELLRRIPLAPRTGRAIAAEVVVVLLAAVAVVQLMLTDGELTGVGSFATGLVVVAAALVAGRLLLPWATVIARRALRAGRLGSGLAGFQLSRRPGAIRLFALLVATVAVAGYAAGAVDVAARGRGVEAGLGTGADRVLTVAPVSRQALLGAVRTADPGGKYAMGVVRITADKQHPPVLAVDSTRLAAVAQWPADGPSVTRAARLLRPPAAPAPLLKGADLTFDLTTEGFGYGKEVTVTAIVSPIGDLSDELVRLGVMRNGRHTYSYELPQCEPGCYLNTMRIEGGEGSSDVAGKLTLHAMTSVPAAALTAPGRWRAGKGGTVAPAPDGLLIDVTSLNGLPEGMAVQPADTPMPVPVASAGPGGGPVMSGLDAHDVAVSHVAQIPAVPGIGVPATLVDLDYLDKVSSDGGQSVSQVWMTSDAPVSVREALSKAGLLITSDLTAAQVRRQLDDQGPALALWFYVIVAVLATALAAGALVLSAGVDRPRRVEDLSALRGQGLSRAALRTAILWTYPVLVAVAVVAGVLIARLGWLLTGWALPLAGLDPPPLPLPGAPHPLVLLAAGLVMFLVLALVAVLSGRRTLRLIR